MNRDKALPASDTIVALSTPPGRGGIAIVRMSGPASYRIAMDIFRASREAPEGLLPQRLTHGRIVATDGEEIDEVLVSFMRAPASYTKEDIVEINCHGGMVAVRRVMETCLARGARLAEPGEFTKRAFLNGRLDLAQAEAVLDIINSKTDAARRAALCQLEGTLSGRISDLKERLLKVLTSCELSIDFGEEDVEQAAPEEVTAVLAGVDNGLAELIASSEKGMALREGVNVVICGKPNVGKSSLMNLMLRRERVIVTSVPGTTRDVVREAMDLEGVRVELSDTAGIIDTTDRLEKEGIKRSLKALDEADMVIFVLDASRGLTERDRGIYRTVRVKKHVIVLNKTDLPREMDSRAVGDLLEGDRPIEFSVKEKRGVEELEEALLGHILGSTNGAFPDIMVTALRHKELLADARAALRRVLDTARDEFSAELVASDIREAMRFLGEITGETASPDVLERIFEGFCIGK